MHVRKGMTALVVAFYIYGLACPSRHEHCRRDHPFSTMLYEWPQQIKALCEESICVIFRLSPVMGHCPEKSESMARLRWSESCRAN